MSRNVYEHSEAFEGEPIGMYMSYKMGTPKTTSLEPDYYERKKDQDKDPWDLLPWEQVEAIVKVLKFGAKKYEPESWQGLPDGEKRYFEAAIRHLIHYRKMRNGTTVAYDEESGIQSLAHAACDVLFLMYLELQRCK